LPEQWLWDIVDEFIYQFQSFCVWRAKVKAKTEDELAMLAESGQVRSSLSGVVVHGCSMLIHMAA
jgi:translation initiation factor 3 subunit L